MSALAFVLALLPGACYPPPVVGPITDPFRAPACAQCAGNRGLEYATHVGQRVTAVAPGVVSFSGLVAGTRYVVVLQPDGRRATYGRLASTAVALGAAVTAGSVVGTASTGLFFGFREGDVYVDPAPLLGRWRFRPRLLPSDGAAPRPAPPPRLGCGGE